MGYMLSAYGEEVAPFGRSSEHRQHRSRRLRQTFPEPSCHDHPLFPAQESTLWAYGAAVLARHPGTARVQSMRSASEAQGYYEREGTDPSLMKYWKYLYDSRDVAIIHQVYFSSVHILARELLRP